MLCSTGFLTVVPAALYAALIAWSGDFGGPLNLVIIPAASAIIGLGVSLVAFLPVSLLVEQLSFRRSLWTSGGISAVLTAVVVLAWIEVIAVKASSHRLVLFSLGASLCLYLVGGLFVYLCSLAIGRRVFP